MIQLPWLTGPHKYETPQKKVIPKKRGKDILFDKSNEEKKINKPR